MHLLYRAAFAVALLFSPVATAATITVNTLEDEANSDGDCSLREAVLSANTNTSVDGCTAGESGSDSIVFAVTTVGTITLGQAAFEVTEDVSISGGVGGSLNAISGGDTYRIFNVTSGTLTLDGIVLTDGRAASGAGVYVRPGAGLDATSVTFQDHVATGDEATNGGAAVYNEGGLVMLSNATFTGNAATGTSGSGGAVFNSGGQLVVMQSTFSGNRANRAGGALEVSGDAASTEISDTDFASNMAGSNPGNGGALHITGGSSSTITDGEVTGNMAAREGGGFWNGSGVMTISEVDFSGNEAQGPAADDGGGALFNNGGTMVVNGGQIEENTATGDAGSGGGVLTLGGSLTINGTVISDNEANRAGAGVESAGAMTTLTDVSVTGNVIPAETAAPGNGGGVHAGGGTLALQGGLYSDNEATEGGGVWANGTLTVIASAEGQTTMTANVGRGNDAANGGGGLFVESGGNATMEDLVLTGNFATGTSGSGGGLFVASEASATLLGGSITANQANRAGGGIEVAGGTLELRGVEVSGNLIPEDSANPGNGGGLHAGGGMVNVFGGQFVGNEATEGGGLWSNGSLTVASDDDEPTEISSNIGRGDDASNGGGGVYAESGATITLTDAEIMDNEATGTSGSGGGLLVADGSQVIVLRGTFSGNAANRAGGGIEVADDGATDNETLLSVTQATLMNNRIETAAPGNGGALHIGGAGMVRIYQSTVADNMAREGAGLWASGASMMEVINSTVSGNSSTEDGGGIYDDGGASISVESSTVALNDAGGNGGGMLSQTTDAFMFQNTVVALNSASSGADCFGTFVSEDYNLVQNTASCVITGDTGNNITGQDPMLGPLADNGGVTMTHEPMMGSPLIDAGQTDLDVDQRDFGRTVGQDDIGAVERGATVDEEGTPTASSLALSAARPNPASGETTLAFTVAEAGDARVELYNVLGQRVMVAFDGAASADGESVRLDVSSLAPGVYVVRLQSGNAQATQRITVVR